MAGILDQRKRFNPDGTPIDDATTAAINGNIAGESSQLLSTAGSAAPLTTQALSDAYTQGGNAINSFQAGDLGQTAVSGLKAAGNLAAAGGASTIDGAMALPRAIAGGINSDVSRLSSAANDGGGVVAGTIKSAINSFSDPSNTPNATAASTPVAGPSAQEMATYKAVNGIGANRLARPASTVQDVAASSAANAPAQVASQSSGAASSGPQPTDATSITGFVNSQPGQYADGHLPAGIVAGKASSIAAPISVNSASDSSPIILQDSRGLSPGGGTPVPAYAPSTPSLAQASINQLLNGLDNSSGGSTGEQVMRALRNKALLARAQGISGIDAQTINGQVSQGNLGVAQQNANTSYGHLLNSQSQTGINAILAGNTLQDSSAKRSVETGNQSIAQARFNAESPYLSREAAGKADLQDATINRINAMGGYQDARAAALTNPAIKPPSDSLTSQLYSLSKNNLDVMSGKISQDDFVNERYANIMAQKNGARGGAAAKPAGINSLDPAMSGMPKPSNGFGEPPPSANGKRTLPASTFARAQSDPAFKSQLIKDLVASGENPADHGL